LLRARITLTHAGPSFTTVINVKERTFAFLPVWNIFRSREKRILLHVTNSMIFTGSKYEGQVETSAEREHGSVAVYIKIGRLKLYNF
jgi:hypothetical protein